MAAPRAAPSEIADLMTLHVNDRFKRATIRLVLANQFREPIANRDETRGRTQRARIMNDSEIKRAGLPAVAIDDGHAGVAQRSVNRQNAHRLTESFPLSPSCSLSLSSFLQDGID